MKNDLVSIIVPIYNSELYLEKCIKSIINQSYKNIEIILVDDGSTDNSGKICDDYAKKDNRIKVIHKKNSGVSSSRNIGIESAKGKYIMFVDSDDYVEEDYTGKLLQSIDGLDYVQCNFNIVTSEKTTHETIIKKNELVNDLSPIKLAILSLKYGSEHNYSNSRCCCGKIYLSKIIKDNNIRFNENIYLLEDGLFNLDYLKYCKKGFLLSDCLYYYSQVETSASHRYNKDQLNQYRLVETELKKHVTNDIENQYYYVVSFQHLLTYIIRNIRFNNNKKQNIIDIKQTCKEQYRDTIKSVKYKNLMKSEKIMLFMLRRKLYRLIYFCLNIREKIRGKK